MYEINPTHDLDLQPADPVEREYCDTCDKEAEWDDKSESYILTHGCGECCEEIDKETCKEWKGMCPECSYIYHL